MANQKSGKSSGGSAATSSQGKPATGAMQPRDANAGMRPNAKAAAKSAPSAQVLQPATNSAMKPLPSPPGGKQS